MSRIDKYDFDIIEDDVSLTQELELERYRKYLKSIRKYDPNDEEEFLHLTNEMNQMIDKTKEKLTEEELLDLTQKLEKIEMKKDYTVELLELTQDIKKILSTTKKEIPLPKVGKKENPKKEKIKVLTTTSILPKINSTKKKNEDEKPLEHKETTTSPTGSKKDEKMTLKDLIDKNIQNNPVEHFDTVKINRIRSTIKMAEKSSTVRKEINKKERIVWSVIFGCSILTLLVIGFRFVNWQIENKNVATQITDIYKAADVVEVVSMGTVTDVEDLVVPESPTVEEPPEEPTYVRPNDYWYYMSMSMLNANFDELKKINSDTAGWIQLPGTTINYPYVQTTDNEYYLKHSFNKSYNSAGWVFQDYRNDKEEYGRNNILYAHSRLDDTMFGSLRYVVLPSWYNNPNNYVVKTSTPTANALWQVFSVYLIEPESYYIRTEFTDTEFETFLNTITSRSVHDFNVSTSIEDKILTLSSCYYERRVVLHAKLIRLEEK